MLKKRAFLSSLGKLHQTQIFATIQTVDILKHFDEILQEVDGIILYCEIVGLIFHQRRVKNLNRNATDIPKTS